MTDFHKARERLWVHSNKTVSFLEDQFKTVIDRCEMRIVQKGAFIHKQGRIPSYGGYVLQGALRHFHIDPHTGVETTVGFEFEDACVGDLRSMFNREGASTSLQALEDSVLMALSKEDYLYLLDHCKPLRI